MPISGQQIAVAQLGELIATFQVELTTWRREALSTATAGHATTWAVRPQQDCIAVFTLVVAAIVIWHYRETLD